MDGSQLPPAPQSIKTRPTPEQSIRKQLTDNRTCDSSRRGDASSPQIRLLGYLRSAAGRSTYPSESDLIFHDPEAQLKALALCDTNSTDNLQVGVSNSMKRHRSDYIFQVSAF